MSAPAPHAHDAAARQPPAELLAEMRRHLDERHGISLVSGRDIYGVSPDPAALLNWEAQSFARPARFWCARCPGMVFAVGDPPYGDPQRNSFLRRSDPTIERLTAGLPADEREALTEAYDRGSLATALSELISGNGRAADVTPGRQPVQGEAGRRRATSRSRPKPRRVRPGDVQRKQRCQAALLDLVERGLTVEEAIDELDALHKTNPAEHRRIFGRDRPYALETIKSYWKTIPPERREEARAKGNRRPVHEVNAERARRRSAKATR